MFEVNAVFLYLIVFSGWILFRIIRAARHGLPNFWREAAVNVLFLFLCYLVYQTFSPFYFSWFRSARSVNFVPLVGIFKMIRTAQALNDSVTTRQVAINLLGNVLIFAPVGFLVALLNPWARKFGHMLLVGLLVSGSIEAAQYFLAVRVMDVDDLLLNVLGTLLGIGLFAMMSGAGLFQRFIAYLDRAARPGEAAFTIAYSLLVLLTFVGLFFFQGWRVTVPGKELERRLEAYGYTLRAEASWGQARAVLVENPGSREQVLMFSEVLPGRLVQAYTWELNFPTDTASFHANLLDAGRDGVLSLIVTQGVVVTSLELDGLNVPASCAEWICLVLGKFPSLAEQSVDALKFVGPDGGQVVLLGE